MRPDEMPATLLDTAAARLDRPRLEHAARRELAWLRHRGELPADCPTVQDVMEAVVAAFEAGWDPGADSFSAYLRALRHLHRVLDDQRTAGRVRGAATSSTARSGHEESREAGAVARDGIRELWPPDVFLTFEELIPASGGARPEAPGDEEGLHLLRLLNDLPIRWRRAVTLYEIEGLSLPDLGELMGVRPARVEAWLDSANRYLQARLREAGHGTVLRPPSWRWRWTS